MALRYEKEKEMVAAKTREDALNAGAKYFIGSLCNRGHLLTSKAPMSLRYASNNECVKCGIINSKKIAMKNKSLEIDSKARHAIEDIMLARELGISVDDLK